MASISKVVAFSARDVAHWNALRNALVNVLGIADDAQAYAQVAQVLFGSGLASITKDGSSDLLLADPVAGTKQLADLGGAAVAAAPVYLGTPMVYDTGGYGLGNDDILLIPVVLNSAVTLTDMQLGVGSTSASNVQLGVYDVTGNLLRKTAVVTNSIAGLRKIALSTSLSLVSGRFWLALACSGGGSYFVGWKEEGELAKVVVRGAWAELPDSVTIPATAAGSFLPSIQAIISGGIY